MWEVLEDGVEVENVISNNLAVLTRASLALLSTDATPASFWITNANNVITGNAAAGAQNYGFWINPEPHPTGASAGTTFGRGVCPQGAPLLNFSSNVAHSNGRYGLRIYSAVGGFFPTHSQCDTPSASNPYVSSSIRGLLSYRNKVNGVQISRVAALVISSAQIVDNGERGVEMPGAQGGLLVGPWGANVLEDTLIVGALAAGATALHRTGIETAAWHRLLVRRVTFSQFALPGMTAVTGLAKMQFTPQGGGWETRFEGITWEDAPHRIKWRHMHEGIFVDVDGSFTGTPGRPAVHLPSNGMLTDPRAFPECTSDTHVVAASHPGLVCVAPSLRFLRLAINNVRPSSALRYLDLLLRHDGSRGSYVAQDDATYLADKWRPVGDRFLVSMQVGAGLVRPTSVGAALWEEASGVWWPATSTLAGGGSFTFDEFSTDGTLRQTARTATLSADGGLIVWNDSFTPWVRCSVRPAGCVGPVRYDDIPTTSAPYGLKRRTHERGYVALLPVNRLYELEFNLDETSRVDVERFSFGIGELQDGEWLALRTAPAVRLPDHLETRFGGSLIDADWKTMPNGEGVSAASLVVDPSAASYARLQQLPSGAWHLDNHTQASVVVFRDSPTCASVVDPCIAQAGTFVADPCPESDPGCMLPPSPAPFDGARYVYQWSDPEAWNGTGVPVDGSSVVIPPDRHIVLDVSTARLQGLTIFGKLQCDEKASSLQLSAEWILIRGSASAPGELVCGEADAPFAGTLEVVLSGDRYSAGPALGTKTYGSKVLLVLGVLQLYAPEPSHAWTTLAQAAEAGAKELLVNGHVDWPAGGVVALPSTSYEPSEAESATLASVELLAGQTSRLTLTASLAFRHASSAEAHGGRSIEMRGEVAYLTRSIVVRGSDSDEAPEFRSLHVGETGAQLIVEEYAEVVSGAAYAEELGEARIVGVRIAQAGVHGYDDRPAVGFHNLGRLPSGHCILRMSVVENSFNVGVQVSRTSGVEMAHNVIYNSLGSSVRVQSAGNLLQSNLAIGAVTTLTYNG